MKKNLALFIAITVFIIPLIYLVTAFTVFDLNIYNWSPVTRFADFIAFLILGILAAFGIYSD